MARNLGFVPTHQQPYYFLSYNSEDQSRVAAYAKEMAGRGMPLWYDEGIEVGTKWERTIALRIKECEAVVMFLSKGIFAKTESYVHKEFEMARHYFNKRIFIVLLDRIEKQEVPVDYVGWWIDVTGLQCIDASDFDTSAKCVDRLMREVDAEHMLPVSAPAPTPAPVSVPVKTETLRFENGDVYEGPVQNGQPHGKGKMTFANGLVYEGDFVEGKRHGKGKYTYTNGSVYEGGIVSNLPSGKGKRIYADGDVYEGDFVSGMHTGKGKYVYADGDVYEGDFFRMPAPAKVNIPPFRMEMCMKGILSMGNFTARENIPPFWMEMCMKGILSMENFMAREN